MYAVPGDRRLLLNLRRLPQDEIIAWVAAEEDGTNAGFVFGPAVIDGSFQALAPSIDLAPPMCSQPIESQDSSVADDAHPRCFDATRLPRPLANPLERLDQASSHIVSPPQWLFRCLCVESALRERLLALTGARAQTVPAWSASGRWHAAKAGGGREHVEANSRRRTSRPARLN